MPDSEPDETDAIAIAIALSVVDNPEAPPDLQLFAQQYWELSGVDVDSGEPQWRFKTTNLDFAPWSGTAHYAAAAGAITTAEDYVCGTCDRPFTLTSRQALLDVIRGNATECRSCNDQADQQAAKIISGDGLAKRAAKLLEKEKSASVQQSRVQLEADRRAYIEAKYLIEDDSEEYFLDQVPVTTRIGVLSVISGTGDEGGMLVGVNLHDQSIAPTVELSGELFVAAWSGRLLQVHPATPTNSLEWEEGAAVGTGAIYTDRVRFFAGSSGSLPERLSNMVDAAHIRVSIAGIWSTERRELETLARRVVAEEAARYLTSEVAAHNLPLLTDKNKEALKLVTERGASLFSLGHLYGFAWRAARDSSSAYQRNQGMPGEKAIIHGLRKYETYIQAALDDPASMKDPFNESTVVPLSAVTRLLFNDIFGLNPMTATPQDIADALASPPDEELLAQCDAGIPARSELVERIRTSRDQWTPGQFRTILARLEDWQPPLCAPHCAHERVGAVAVEVGRTFDRIVSLTDDETAAIMTAEATGVANSLRDGIRTGDALLAELVSRLGIDVTADEDVTYF
jgi:hypothetical protein